MKSLPGISGNHLSFIEMMQHIMQCWYAPVFWNNTNNLMPVALMGSFLTGASELAYRDGEQRAKSALAPCLSLSDRPSLLGQAVSSRPGLPYSVVPQHDCQCEWCHRQLAQRSLHSKLALRKKTTNPTVSEEGECGHWSEKLSCCFFLFKFFTYFYCSMADSQYCVSFRCPCVCFKYDTLIGRLGLTCAHFWSCVCMCDAQSRLTLYQPCDYNPPGSYVQGIFQARILEWVAVSYSRGCSWLRDQSQWYYV